MKKILAMLLTVAMLLSLVIVATVSVAADDENAGMWTTWGSSEQYDADFSDDLASVPGYEYAEDGLPYALPCEFSDILVSPYEPYYQLDYSKSNVGDKVWDPYTRKPFYVPRFMTIN